MAQLRITRTFEANNPLLEEDLDTFLDDIETFFNTTKIDDENIQAASITASSKFADASVTLSKVAADAAITAKFDTDSVTAAKLNADTAGTALSLSTAGLEVDCDDTQVVVTSDQITIADGSVPLTKLSLLSTSVSSLNSGSYNTNSLSFNQVTNLTANLTTTGRPVIMMLIGPSTPGNNGVKFTPPAIGTNVFGVIGFYRDSTRLCELGIGCNSSAAANVISLPGQTFLHYEVPAAGTYTYSVYAAVSNVSAALNVTNCRLLVMEV